MLHIICWAVNDVTSALILGGISINVSLESIFAAVVAAGAAAACFVMVSFEHVSAAGLRCGGLKEGPRGQVDGFSFFIRKAGSLNSLCDATTGAQKSARSELIPEKARNSDYLTLVLAYFYFAF